MHLSSELSYINLNILTALELSVKKLPLPTLCSRMVYQRLRRRNGQNVCITFFLLFLNDNQVYPELMAHKFWIHWTFPSEYVSMFDMTITSS